MRRTIDRLRHRRGRYRSRPPIPRFWSLALITVNLILIAFFLMDAPVGSYAAHTPGALRRLGRIITDFGSAGWILFVSAVLFFEGLAVTRLIPSLKARFEALVVVHVAAYVFVTVAASGLAVNLLKRVIGRARPGLYQEWGFFGFQPFANNARFESFPSGHSTTVGAVLMAMALLAPRYRVFFLIAALWLGFSRVIVGAHYPSDVIAGLSFGAWSSVLVAVFFSRHGLLFRQAPDGWPILRRPLPLRLRPDWKVTPFPPRGLPFKRQA